MTTTTPPLPYLFGDLTLPAQLTLLDLDEYTPEPIHTPPPSPQTPPPPPPLLRTKRTRNLLECVVCHQPSDNLDALNECINCAAFCMDWSRRWVKRIKRSPSFDIVMKELQLAARVLPLYHNTNILPVDFSASRIKKHKTYYRHLLPQPLVGIETNPGPTFVSSSVTLLHVMGDDKMVVNAARVSFGKEIDCMEEADERLIKYLAEHGHWSPFSHPQIQFRIKIPIFVARQWFKHTVGFSRNEISRRYVNSKPQFYECKEWRLTANNKKQGSSDQVSMISGELSFMYEMMCQTSLANYNNMIKNGVCPEQARMLLPQSMMTEFIETGSLYAYARLCRLRLDPHAQKEIREVANEIYYILKDAFPSSWVALMKDVPAPPLVGVELNPGPSDSRKLKILGRLRNKLLVPKPPTDSCPEIWPLLGMGNLNLALEELVWIHGTCNCGDATALAPCNRRMRELFKFHRCHDF